VAEAGQTLELPIPRLTRIQIHDTLSATAGIDKPFHDQTRGVNRRRGFGAGRAILRKLAVMGSVEASSYEST
jgi:hypothetical protein